MTPAPASERDTAPERDTPEACPFCGESRVPVHHDGTAAPLPWRAWCYECGAYGPQCESEPEARAAWNRRAPGWRAKAKPLDWRHEGEGRWAAYRPAGDDREPYTVKAEFASDGAITAMLWLAHGYNEWHPSVDAAKAAAQEHFASRLAACIEPAPSEAGWLTRSQVLSALGAALCDREYGYVATRLEEPDLAEVDGEFSLAAFIAALRAAPPAPEPAEVGGEQEAERRALDRLARGEG